MPGDRLHGSVATGSSFVQGTLDTIFQLTYTSHLLPVDTTPRSSDQATGANCASVMQLMIRKIWTGQRARTAISPANHGVTDAARTRNLRSHKWVVGARTKSRLDLTNASPLSNTVVWFDLTLQPVVGSSPSSAAEESEAGKGEQSHEHDRSEHGSKQQHEQEPD